MSPLKKIDYRQLSKEAPQEMPQQAPQEGVPVPAPVPLAEQAPQQVNGEKQSFFGSLINKWTLMEKKAKIEFLVFVIVILSTITMVGYYFSKSITPKVIIPESEKDWPAENEPPDTVPRDEYSTPIL